MANLMRGEVSFEASGKTWTMKMGTGAMCEIEAATNKSISEIGSSLGNPKTASITLLRTVFWGSLQHHHVGTSVKDCDDLIDEIGMVRAGQLVGEAFQSALPKKAGAARPPVATTE